MNLALNQAKINLGNTKENPAVGCVIVKNNNVISAGFTSINGRPHAEDNAIKFSKKNIKNSSIYVTLEPCSNYGKTTPCVKKIIKKKIKKVFFSIKDADPRSYNKSTKLFNKFGLNTQNGLLRNEINSFYNSYYKFKKKELPFVTYKLAMSKDFFISRSDKNRWITNSFSRGRVHLMRSTHDCLITSADTIASDNPLLTCRINGLISRSPARIILDREVKIPIKSKILKEAKHFKTILLFNKQNPNKLKLLKKYKVITVKVPLDKNGNLNLVSVLLEAKKFGFSRIFLECGIKLASSFFEQNLIDDLFLFISKDKLNKFGKIKVRKSFKIFLKNKKKYYKKVNLLGDKLIYYKIK